MTALFSGGFFLGVVGIVRAWLLWKFYWGAKDVSCKLLQSFLRPQFTFGHPLTEPLLDYGYYFYIVAAVEVNGGLIFCSVPALKVSPFPPPTHRSNDSSPAIRKIAIFSLLTRRDRLSSAKKRTRG